MALVYVGKMNVPNYTALSSDVVANNIPLASIPGATIFLTDTAEWKIIKKDLTLADYALPIVANITGDIVVGDVGITQPVASAVLVSPFYSTQAVAVPGTGEPLMAVATYAISLTIFPKAGNTDNVFVGNNLVDKDTSQQLILQPTSGSQIVVDAPIGYKIDLHQFYVDAVVANEGVKFLYMK
jgi:hypothetical protein